MTRNEEILNQAVKEQSQLYTSSDWRAGFISGAKWADENPNLYSDEKYHTVKVSQLDELNRKVELYDKFVDKACEWLCRNTNKHIDDKYLTMSFNLTNEMINDFRKAMEE